MGEQLAFPRPEVADDAVWTVHTDVFEGPLDLLLYLVKRDGIDLTRLPLAHIADAYLDYVDALKGMNLSVAGEYLVMAATLIHLKSLELLPRAPTPIDEDAPDPRAEFAQRLRDYKRYKEAAAELAERPRLGRDQHRRPEQEPIAGEVIRPFDVFGLLDTYRKLLEVAEEPEPEVRFFDEVGLDLGTAATNLLRFLDAHGGSHELGPILASLPSRSARVITFISTLEMMKLAWISVKQESHLGAIVLTSKVKAEDADMHALTGWVATAEEAIS